MVQSGQKVLLARHKSQRIVKGQATMPRSYIMHTDEGLALSTLTLQTLTHSNQQDQ